MRENASSSPNAKPYWLVLLGVIVAFAQFLGPNTDFKVYIQAGRDFLNHGWLGIYHPAGLTPFKYHPALIPLCVPFALLPLMYAQLFWAVLSGAAFADSLRRLGRVRDHEFWEYLIGFLFVIHALTWQAKLANITLLLLWCFAVFLSSESKAIKIFCLGVLITVKPYWALLLGPAVLKKEQRYLLLSSLIPISLALLVWGLAGSDAKELWGQWLETLNHPVHAHNFPKSDNQSWFAFCYRYLSEPNTRLAAFLIGSGVALILWTAEGFTAVAAAVVILWLGPLSWIHQQVFILPALYLWRPWRESPAFAVLIWFGLNGTGQLIWGHAGFTFWHQLGIPTFTYLLVLIGLVRLNRQNSTRGWALPRSGEWGVREKSYQ